MKLRDQFLVEIESFLVETGMGAADFGERCMGDRGFMTRLRAGRGFSDQTYDKVMRFMARERAKRPSLAA